MIYAASLSREEFIDWLGRGFTPTPKELTASHLAKSIEPGGLALLWENKPDPASPDSPQPVIAVPGREMREFFAFVGTYVSTYQPFSAFFRVVPLEDVPNLLGDISPRNRLTLPNMLMGGCNCRS